MKKHRIRIEHIGSSQEAMEKKISIDLSQEDLNYLSESIKQCIPDVDEEVRMQHRADILRDVGVVARRASISELSLEEVLEAVVDAYMNQTAEDIHQS